MDKAELKEIADEVSLDILHLLNVGWVPQSYEDNWTG